MTRRRFAVLFLRPARDENPAGVRLPPRRHFGAQTWQDSGQGVSHCPENGTGFSCIIGSSGTTTVYRRFQMNLYIAFALAASFAYAVFAIVDRIEGKRSGW